MDSRQIDVAMRNRTPVTYNGQKYVRILEYISWYDEQGKRNLSAVLLADGNYTVRVPAEKVEEQTEKNGVKQIGGLYEERTC